MNTAHWHLLLNHLPITGTIFGLLILVAGFVFKNNTGVKQTALGVFVFSALCAIPAYLTGEGTEEIVEKMPGVTETIIDTHEDLGKIFLIVIEALGVLALLTFITDRFQKKAASLLYVLVLITAIGTSVFAKWVGTSGGEIRHTEIRLGASTQPGNAVEQNGKGEKDED